MQCQSSSSSPDETADGGDDIVVESWTRTGVIGGTVRRYGMGIPIAYDDPTGRYLIVDDVLVVGVLPSNVGTWRDDDDDDDDDDRGDGNGRDDSSDRAAKTTRCVIVFRPLIDIGLDLTRPLDSPHGMIHPSRPPLLSTTLRRRPALM